MSRFHYIPVALTLCVAATGQEIPLAVEDITIDEGVIEFSLVNVGKKPITAWYLEVTTTVAGLARTSAQSHDFAATTEFPETGPDGHDTGALMPNDFHRHRLHRLETPDEVAVQPTVVVFDDLSGIGPEEIIARFFEKRQARKAEYRRWLIMVRSLRGKSEKATHQSLVDLADTLEGSIVRRGGLLSKSTDSVKSLLLTNLRFALSQEETIGTDQVLHIVTEVLRLHYESLRKHTPPVER